MLANLRIGFDRLMAWATGLSAFVMFGVVLASSVSRYAFNQPFQWSEEAARYAMIYGTMFGAALAYNRSRHMRFSMLADMLGPRWGTVFAAIADLTALAVGAILAVSGWGFVQKRGGIDAPGIGVSVGWFQAAMVVGGACLVIVAVLDLASRFEGGERPEVDPV